VWREWGRSIALGDASGAASREADVLLVWLTLGLPPLQLATGRGGAVAAGLFGVRLLVSLALAPSSTVRGPAYWLSPLADPLAAIRLTVSATRRPRTWRGRTYA
jgi:dolichol-phosphate mannosyltransferase